ncbi:Isochorismatase hydrolase [Pyrrhoderma noxium]|uniref:Isochorismatase hydrolase n=1 Tax=Pyrrhoderma noxium TaxID=2282107 RepID=A0A286UNH6_9AGAM|nr:Isochorismatase hydrolase [Pyrrhoderma noxium]
MSNKALKLLPYRTIFFISDLQTRFRGVIHGFDHVVATTNKMLKIANVLEIPVVVSEQNPTKLGKTVEELDFTQLGSLHRMTVEKSLFSLLTPEVGQLLLSVDHAHIKSVVLMGIESHICVLQTTLDLLERGYDVHVLADGVSSCNKEEIPWALERMRQAGAQITTSESVAYQLMGDAGNVNFRAFANIIKEESEATKNTVKNLLGQPKPTK